MHSLHLHLVPETRGGIHEGSLHQRPAQHPAAGTAPGGWHGTGRPARHPAAGTAPGGEANTRCLPPPFTLLGSYREGKGSLRTRVRNGEAGLFLSADRHAQHSPAWGPLSAAWALTVFYMNF